MQDFIRGFLDKISHYNVMVDAYLKASGSAPDPASAFLNWGVQLAESGQLDVALEKFKKAAQMAPHRPECYTNWGIALAKMGRLEEASEQFEAAIARDPKAPSNYLMWGAVLMEQGQLEAAHAKYKKALSLRPHQADLHTHWGISLTLSKRFHEAIDQYRQSLGINPQQPQVCFLWGATLAELGDYEAAIDKFKEAIRYEPKFFDALYCWSVALNKLGRHKDALEKAKQALDINPERPEVYLALGDALAGQNRLEIAIANYRQAIQLVPDQPDAHVGLASALYRLHQSEAALPVIERAIKLMRAANGSAASDSASVAGYAPPAKPLEQFASTPEPPADACAPDPISLDLYMLWVNILISLHKYPQALQSLQQGLSAYPGHVGLALQQATTLLKLGRAKEAVDILVMLESRAQELPEAEPGLYYVLGTHYLSANELYKAKTCFEQALTLDADHQEAAISLSLVLSDLGKAQEAVLLLRPFYRKYGKDLNPDAKPDVRMIFYYGMALFSAGDAAEAIQKFEQALSLNDHYQEAKVALGEVYLAQGRTQEAISQLEATVAAHPAAELAWMLLSLAYSQQHQWQKAIDAVEAQLALNPASQEAWGRRAQLEVWRAAEGVQTTRKHVSDALEAVLLRAEAHLPAQVYGQLRQHAQAMAETPVPALVTANQP
ncbi:MAG: tetratricopeptide repeat protein [Vampirovibrionales bacterium]|nr:tetratricopeptide repeat protein [Vampirovibrionales bacterium]